MRQNLVLQLKTAKFPSIAKIFRCFKSFVTVTKLKYFDALRVLLGTVTKLKYFDALRVLLL